MLREYFDQNPVNNVSQLLEINNQREDVSGMALVLVCLLSLNFHCFEQVLAVM
jgi:hypothetical protein